MFVIEIEKLPDRKRKAITVYDTEKPVTHYVIGYINCNEELFIQALVDSKNIEYVKDKSE